VIILYYSDLGKTCIFEHFIPFLTKNGSWLSVCHSEHLSPPGCWMGELLLHVGRPRADIFLHVPTTYHSQSTQWQGYLHRCGASAERLQDNEGPLPPVCLDLGHCTPWIQLIHSHPIVITLLCDWPNSVRTSITLNRWESWYEYKKEWGRGGKNHNLGNAPDWLDTIWYSPWGTSTQRKLRSTKLICRRSSFDAFVSFISLKVTLRSWGWFS